MTELIFIIEQAVDGRYSAWAVGESIFTEGDDLESLKENVRDAVKGHFEPAERPEFISFQIAGPLTKEQMDELDRRIEEHRKNPSDTISWEEVTRNWSNG